MRWRNELTGASVMGMLLCSRQFADRHVFDHDIIETFKPGAAPRYQPAGAVRIDTS
jgi:hypothetical protein